MILYFPKIKNVTDKHVNALSMDIIFDFQINKTYALKDHSNFFFWCASQSNAERLHGMNEEYIFHLVLTPDDAIQSGGGYAVKKIKILKLNIIK